MSGKGDCMTSSSPLQQWDRRRPVRMSVNNEQQKASHNTSRFWHAYCGDDWWRLDWLRLFQQIMNQSEKRTRTRMAGLEMQTVAVGLTQQHESAIKENKQKQTHPLLLLLNRTTVFEPIIPASSLLCFSSIMKLTEVQLQFFRVSLLKGSHLQGFQISVPSPGPTECFYETTEQ